MAQHHELGKLGEDFAANFLMTKGFKIIFRNWRCRHLEVDIVAMDANTLVFVEVKERKNIEHAMVAISKQQQKRIVMAAQVFLQRNPQYRDFDIRFDAVFVKLPFTIVHIKNAWGAEVLQNKNPRR